MVRQKYDNLGNLIELTDPKGLVETRQYDGRNRLMETVYPDELRHAVGYDVAGRVVADTLVSTSSHVVIGAGTTTAHPEEPSQTASRRVGGSESDVMKTLQSLPENQKSDILLHEMVHVGQYLDNDPNLLVPSDRVKLEFSAWDKQTDFLYRNRLNLYPGQMRYFLMKDDWNDEAKRNYLMQGYGKLNDYK